MRTALVTALLAVVIPACDSGIEGTGAHGDAGVGSADAPDNPDTPHLSASVDKTSVTTELGKTETVVVSVTSENGFAGSVPITLSLLDGTTDVSTGFTLTPTPASLDITAGGMATAMLEVKIPSDAAALAPTLKVDLGGTAPTSVTSTFAIDNRYTVEIPAGTGTGSPHTGLPALNAPIKLRAGAMLVFHNADNTRHIIHGNGGIPHEDQTNGGPPGGSYMVVPSGDATWYCHDHEPPTQARAVIIE